MSIFNIQENRIKCGRCGTEFDLNKNKGKCPLCGFGRSTFKEASSINPLKEEAKVAISDEFLSIPPSITLNSGNIHTNEETETWGSWLMVNDFFSIKLLSRILAWKITKEDSNYINLMTLIKDSVTLIQKYNLSKLKGFPSKIENTENLQKDSAVRRLVYHFLSTGRDMGLFDLKPVDDSVSKEDVWNQKWEEILITLTEEGLQFAKLKNHIFDEGKTEQVLSIEEKGWLTNYLKEIDKKKYKEYTILKEVYDFLKEGHNGKDDLWGWFENNQKFRDYILGRIKKLKKDPKIFQKQLHNYARTFAAAKVSLLRELGVVKNKRNDYTIISNL